MLLAQNTRLICCLFGKFYIKKKKNIFFRASEVYLIETGSCGCDVLANLDFGAQWTALSADGHRYLDGLQNWGFLKKLKKSKSSVVLYLGGGGGGIVQQSPSNKAALLVALEGWPLTGGRNKCIGSSSGED